MSEPPVVTLRARTDDDLDVLFEIAADLDTWEERSPSAPAPLTRDRFDARRAADPGNDGVEIDVHGRLREHAWVRGGYEDKVLMGVLRAERSR